MYKTSNDLRFVKNRDALRRAYIDLVKQGGTASVTVKDLAARANVNRMTFYSHYDSVEDILSEYVDDMVAAILGSRLEGEPAAIGSLLEAATEQMRQEVDFFRLVAREEGFAPFRERFRQAFKRVFFEELARASALSGADLAIASDMVASGVTYVYLDWLAGEYGDLPLDDLIARIESVLDNKEAGSLYSCCTHAQVDERPALCPL